MIIYKSHMDGIYKTKRIGFLFNSCKQDIWIYPITFYNILFIFNKSARIVSFQNQNIKKRGLNLCYLKSSFEFDQSICIDIAYVFTFHNTYSIKSFNLFNCFRFLLLSIFISSLYIQYFYLIQYLTYHMYKKSFHLSLFIFQSPVWLH